jgi:peptide subunit release factor RF-3
MGLRAYFLVDVVDDMDQQQFIQAVRDLEEENGVDFVDPVIGGRDLVVMVEAPVSVEVLANKIKENSWVKELEILNIVSIYERHRSSKKQLLKSLTHSGFKAA